MANYYTQMCCKIPCKTKKARDWLLEQHKRLGELWGAIEMIGEMEGDIIQAARNMNNEMGKEPIDLDLFKRVYAWGVLDGLALPGFDLEQDGQDIYVEDDGENVEVAHVADFLQTYLTKFLPDEAIELYWADTASKHEENAFMGGACFVTAETQKWMHSSKWLEQQRKKFDTRHEVEVKKTKKTRSKR